MAFVSEIDNLDLELYFLTEIMKLRSLHYGYFESDGQVDMEALRSAQQKYTDTLIEMIPVGVREVLDVGCGIGDVSTSLHKSGFNVVGISPDKNHSRYHVSVEGKLEFLSSGIEGFQPDRKFDLVLMSESHNYFDTVTGLKKSTQCLKSGGYLLVSGIFRKHENESISELGHTVESYVSAAERMGFELMKLVDITRETRPTLEYAHKCTNDYMEKSMRMIEHFLLSTSVWRKMVISFLFYPQIRRLRKMYAHYRERMDPEFYENHMEYSRLLFRMR